MPPLVMEDVDGDVDMAVTDPIAQASTPTLPPPDAGTNDSSAPATNTAESPAPATNTAESPPAAPTVSHVAVPPVSSVASPREYLPYAGPQKEQLPPIDPAYYAEEGGIPVFKPTMEEFESFPKFVDRINAHGMKSGIVKIIPPKEWLDALPPLDEKVKEIKIKNPIEQHIAGSYGEYRQTNLEKQRAYNLSQWRKLCDSSEHQPPAKRGERRRGLAAEQETAKAKRKRLQRSAKKEVKKEEEEHELTPPETPEPETDAVGRQPVRRTRGGRRWKTAKERAEANEITLDQDFEGFDYRITDADSWTAERCEELERHYWKTLTYNSPLYGADQPGSLFDDTTKSWNVQKLENMLDCLGKKLPGVNTAYLYLGMWKATYAWHLEDMDLYSINYIHFGAPKQWYSISQEDKPKFERAMKEIYANDAKKCAEFLRHKTFLVSPTHLAQLGIKVNKVVHHQGEFVITFPFGYHSGYNLGYNCAESVNFATDSWLDFGRNAARCECIDDAVFLNIKDIERALGLRDDSTEFSCSELETEDEDGPTDLPTPPESVEGKRRAARPRKRKSVAGVDGGGKRVRTKVKKEVTVEPCCLCPNDIPTEELLPTDDGRQAHRLCAIFTPECYFTQASPSDPVIVAGIASIIKARIELRCSFCRTKKGSCFQCCTAKCVRAYHATCAAAAGVLVNKLEAKVQGEDGKIYDRLIIDYRCKMHRPKKRGKIAGSYVDVERLEADEKVNMWAANLMMGDTVQCQLLVGDVFGGVVRENCVHEGTVVLEILPKCTDIVEIDYRYILYPDPPPSGAHLPDGAETAPLTPNPVVPPITKPTLPPPKTGPQPDDAFSSTSTNLFWGELTCERIPVIAPEQLPPRGWWYYLGEMSTEHIQHYTHDIRLRVPNDAALIVPQRRPRNSLAAVAASNANQQRRAQQQQQQNGNPYSSSSSQQQKHTPQRTVPAYGHQSASAWSQTLNSGKSAPTYAQREAYLRAMPTYRAPSNPLPSLPSRPTYTPPFFTSTSFASPSIPAPSPSHSRAEYSLPPITAATGEAVRTGYRPNVTLAPIATMGVGAGAGQGRVGTPTSVSPMTPVGTPEFKGRERAGLGEIQEAMKLIGAQQRREAPVP